MREYFAAQGEWEKERMGVEAEASLGALTLRGRYFGLFCDWKLKQ